MKWVKPCDGLASHPRTKKSILSHRRNQGFLFNGLAGYRAETYNKQDGEQSISLARNTKSQNPNLPDCLNRAQRTSRKKKTPDHIPKLKNCTVQLKCESLCCVLKREILVTLVLGHCYRKQAVLLLQLHLKLISKMLVLPFVVHGQGSRDTERESLAHKDTNGSIHH